MQAAQFELHAELEEKHWWFCGRRRIMRRLVEQVLLDPRNTVIDIGCGTGGNIAALATQYQCIGIDQSAEGIAFARQRFAGVDFICGSLSLELPPRHGPRLFLLMDVIEHIEEDKTFLSQVVDAMEPDDHLLLTVPADMSLWSEHDVSFGHYRRYDIDQLQTLWTDLPLEQRLLSYFNTRLYPAVKLIRALSRLRGQSWGDSGTDLKMPAPPVNSLLERLFSGEATRLIAQLQNNRKRGYKRGVSLIALLRKTARQI